jgi:uncharacterized membrane protein
MEGSGASVGWYLSRDGQQYGPVTDQQVRELLGRGQLLPTDYVWREGFGEWTMAQTVPGLFLAAVPPPNPVTPGPVVVRSSMAAPEAAHSSSPEAQPRPPGNHPILPQTSGEPVSTTAAMAAYVLMLIPIPFFPLIGVIVALVNLGTTSEWLSTHFRWQLRTFLIGLLYIFIGGVTAQLVIGVVMILAAIVWAIVRHVKGIMALNRRQPIENVTTWLW